MQHGLDSAELVARKVSLFRDDRDRLSRVSNEEREVYQKLDDLKRQLDVVFLQSPALYNALIRCISYASLQRPGIGFTDEEIPPITFENHEDAVACAIYALVQIYCDRRLLRHLLLAETGAPTLPLIRWSKVILGIAKGCNPPRYLCEETYNMNMCWIMGLLCLRWPNFDVLTYLTENVLPKLTTSGVSLEDTAGALLLFELVMEMLVTENKRGRKIFVTHLVHESSTHDNGFFLVKKSLHFTIHGHTNDGRFFNDYIPALS
jgi:hypothetical protein